MYCPECKSFITGTLVTPHEEGLQTLKDERDGLLHKLAQVHAIAVSIARRLSKLDTDREELPDTPVEDFEAGIHQLISTMKRKRKL